MLLFLARENSVSPGFTLYVMMLISGRSLLIIDSLTGINSLPVISTASGDEKVVQAPINLLSAPAITAANIANNAASAASLAAIEALSKAEIANSAANQANEKADLASAAAIAPV